MKFHKQLFRHDPANGVWGDCHRTAIACLLDLEPSDVPHFMEGDPTAEEFDRRVAIFLLDRGYVQANFWFEGSLESVIDVMTKNGGGVYYLLGGTSRNGTAHTVVCGPGGIAHDPAQDNSGIVGPLDNGYYCITLLVPIQFVGKAA